MAYNQFGNLAYVELLHKFTENDQNLFPWGQVQTQTDRHTYKHCGQKQLLLSIWISLCVISHIRFNYTKAGFKIYPNTTYNLTV